MTRAAHRHVKVIQIKPHHKGGYESLLLAWPHQAHELDWHMEQVAQSVAGEFLRTLTPRTISVSLVEMSLQEISDTVDDLHGPLLEAFDEAVAKGETYTPRESHE